MSKFMETDFVRFLYSDGSEASSEKKDKYSEVQKEQYRINEQDVHTDLWF